MDDCGHFSGKKQVVMRFGCFFYFWKFVANIAGLFLADFFGFFISKTCGSENFGGNGMRSLHFSSSPKRETAMDGCLQDDGCLPFSRCVKMCDLGNCPSGVGL